MPSCLRTPTWIRRPGITRIEDIGNGTGVLLEWEEARPTNSAKQVHYNIFYADTRVGVLGAEPLLITTARSVVVNLGDPGNIYYFIVRATEFDLNTDIDIMDMEQIGVDLFQYPADQTLLSNLDATEDGYSVAITDVTGFPSIGEIIIGTEVMRYTSVNTIDNELIVPVNDRAILGTTIAEHSVNDTVLLWRGAQDNNSVVRTSVAAWHQVIPHDVAAPGTPNSDADGYRAAASDNLTTDLSASDEENVDFPAYDYCGYHRPSLQNTFSGGCTNSYLGGDYNGSRGLNIQERSLARLDSMLQVTGEDAILLRRKWTGRRCKCIGLRREHQRSRCGSCFGVGFEGGFDRYMNPRAVSELEANTRGLIKIRINPHADDLDLKSDQALMQNTNPTAWTLAVPTVKDRDIIIRFNVDGTEEFRYEIQDVTRNKLMFGDSGKQDFKMIRLDKTAETYTFDISTP